MTTFYLKYRPRKINELDLASVRESLGRILTSAKFSHAYLFTGYRGAGKTSSARILAMLLNCDLNKSGKKLVEPCGKCPLCIQIANSSSLSVMEMDAASNRGIDDIRILRERIGLAPSQGRYTVYIIDEVHMLTNEAFNALLKTLEEPPPHAVFVLCTTESSKIPDTIISRCTRINFSKATPEEIKRCLNKAIKGEKIEISPEAVELLSVSVDGSFRDGMKLLEQLAQTQEHITLETTQQILRLSNPHDIDKLIEFICKKDAAAALGQIAQLDSQSANFNLVIKQLLEKFRQILLDPAQASVISQNDLILVLELLIQAGSEMKYSVIPQLSLEIAVVKFCQNLPASQSASSQVKQKKDTQTTAIPIVKSPEITKRALDAVPITAVTRAVPNEVSILMENNTLAFESIEKRWNEVLTSMRPENHSLEALLKACRPVSSQGNWLIVEVFYAFHKEQLEQERHKRKIEDIISKLFSQNVRLKFQLGKKPASMSKDIVKSVANVSGKVEDEELAQVAEEIFGMQ